MKGWSPESLHKPWPFLVNTFLVSSYLYYHLHCSVLADHDYDALSAHILAHFDEIQAAPVWHKQLLNRDSLRAGTLFDVSEKNYPSVIRMVAYELMRRIPDADGFTTHQT